MRWSLFSALVSTVFAGLGPQALYQGLAGKTYTLNGYNVRPYDRVVGPPPSVINYGLFSDYVSVDGTYQYMFYTNGSSCGSGSQSLQLYVECASSGVSLSPFTQLVPCFSSAIFYTPMACGVSMSVNGTSGGADAASNDPAGVIMGGLALAGVGGGAAFIGVKKARSAGAFDGLQEKFRAAQNRVRELTGRAPLPDSIRNKLNTAIDDPLTAARKMRQRQGNARQSNSTNKGKKVKIKVNQESVAEIRALLAAKKARSSNAQPGARAHSPSEEI